MDNQELKLEQEALVIPSDADLRRDVIEAFGFDEDTDAERIDKAVARDKAQRELNSKAIAAKIKHRKEAEELRGQIPPKVETTTEKKEGLSQSDLIALIKADVAEEDISEVTDYAKLKNISIAEALKNSTVKRILADKIEERKSAEASHTGNARRSTQIPTAEQVLTKARTGELPDDDDGIAALTEARLAEKKATKRV